jgi:single-strand DNA-binding protein
MAMFHVNRVTLLGNVTRAPEPHAAKAGKAVAILSLATLRQSKQDGQTERIPEYHRLVCVGPLASFALVRVRKGAPLYVEGRLRTNHRKTKEGRDVYRTEIVVDRLVLLSSRKESGTATAMSNA